MKKTFLYKSLESSCISTSMYLLNVVSTSSVLSAKGLTQTTLRCTSTLGMRSFFFQNFHKGMCSCWLQTKPVLTPFQMFGWWDPRILLTTIFWWGWVCVFHKHWKWTRQFGIWALRYQCRKISTRNVKFRPSNDLPASHPIKENTALVCSLSWTPDTDLEKGTNRRKWSAPTVTPSHFRKPFFEWQVTKDNFRPRKTEPMKFWAKERKRTPRAGVCVVCLGKPNQTVTATNTPTLQHIDTSQVAQENVSFSQSIKDHMCEILNIFSDIKAALSRV